MSSITAGERARLAWYSVAFTYGAIYRALIWSLVTRATRQRRILEYSHIDSLVQTHVKTNALPSLFVLFSRLLRLICLKNFDIDLFASQGWVQPNLGSQLMVVWTDYQLFFQINGLTIWSMTMTSHCAHPKTESRQLKLHVPYFGGCKTELEFRQRLRFTHFGLQPRIVLANWQN